MHNCRQLYGNFSTCEAAIKLDVENMQTFQFQVSFFSLFRLTALTKDGILNTVCFF